MVEHDTDGHDKKHYLLRINYFNGDVAAHDITKEDADKLNGRDLWENFDPHCYHVYLYPCGAHQGTIVNLGLKAQVRSFCVMERPNHSDA